MTFLSEAQPRRNHKDNHQLFKACQIPDNSIGDFPSTYGEEGLGKQPLQGLAEGETTA